MTKQKFTPPYIPLTRTEVEAITGLCRSSIYAKMRQNTDRPLDFDPTFPLPLKFGPKKVMWRADEIEQWMLTRERSVDMVDGN